MKIPLIPPLYYDNRFITDFKEKVEGCFSLNNAPSFPIIVHFVVTLIILLKNAYLQSGLHFQSKLLAKLFKILILNADLHQTTESRATVR